MKPQDREVILRVVVKNPSKEIEKKLNNCLDECLACEDTAASIEVRYI